MWVVDYVDKKAYAYKRSDKSRDQSRDYDLDDGGQRTLGHLVGRRYGVGIEKRTPGIEAYFSIDPGAKLSAHYVKATTATLYVGGHNAAWWYERTSPTGDATCHSVAAGTKSASLSSLTASTSYTYKAYDKMGCNSGGRAGDGDVQHAGVVRGRRQPSRLPGLRNRSLRPRT